MSGYLKISFLILLATNAIIAQSRSVYNTVHNQFASIDWKSTAQISGNDLTCDNKLAYPVMLLDTNHVSAESYRFYARLSNAHNAEGKRYYSGGKKCDFTEVGIVFLYANQKDYWTATLHAFNSHPHDDMIDKRMMHLSVSHIVDGKATFVRDSDFSAGFDIRGGYNVIGVDVDGSKVKVVAGHDKLTEIMTIDAGPISQPVHMGCLIGSGALMKLERTVISLRSSNRMICETGWTREKLDSLFTVSDNQLEGYWQYLDRDMDDQWLRLGGRYTIALVASGDHYDIVYVDGAEVKQNDWHLGMLKGRLDKTIFTDNYKAQWIDATHRDMGRDVQASVEQGVILTLKFPVWNSEVRFSRIINH